MGDTAGFGAASAVFSWFYTFKTYVPLKKDNRNDVCFRVVFELFYVLADSSAIYFVRTEFYAVGDCLYLHCRFGLAALALAGAAALAVLSCGG